MFIVWCRQWVDDFIDIGVNASSFDWSPDIDAFVQQRDMDRVDFASVLGSR